MRVRGGCATLALLIGGVAEGGEVVHLSLRARGAESLVVAVVVLGTRHEAEVVLVEERLVVVQHRIVGLVEGLGGTSVAIARAIPLARSLEAVTVEGLVPRLGEVPVTA